MKTNRWRNRILWMAFLVCLVLIFCLTAFHRPILSGKESESSSDQKHKVVFIAKSTVSGFWKSVYAGASNAATACNLDLTFKGPKSEEDYETQNQMIAKAVEDGAEVIMRQMPMRSMMRQAKGSRLWSSTATWTAMRSAAGSEPIITMLDVRQRKQP